MQRTTIGVLALTACLSSTALAQQGPPPGCVQPEQRQFDFWVGSWTVTDSAGAVTYGTSSVTNEERGCLIHEHWSGSRGGTGQSLNYFDLSKGQWEQDWVASAAGGTVHLYGHLEDGAMVLEGDQVKGGVSSRQRVMWIPEADGRVRQFWRQSVDSGKTWTVVFDGYYRKTG